MRQARFAAGWRPVALLIALGFSTPVAAAELRADRPNIILILADDLGYGDLGSFGHPTARTPHLDSLADEGMRFTDFHANSPVCSPTRAALLTGRYPQRLGIEGPISSPRAGLPLAEVTVPEVLRAAGYRTAVFGKWHLGTDPGFNPVRQGFDEFVGFVSGNVDYHSHISRRGERDWWRQDQLADEPGYSTDLITEHALGFIEANRNRPFCLFVSYGAPHGPAQGPYDPAERAPSGLSDEAKREFLAKINARIPDPPEGYEKGDTYARMVESMDSGVGRIIEVLKKFGLAQNTLVFFHSDNGPSGGSTGPLRGRKRELWEGGHRVPAVAYWPGRIEAGVVTRETGSSMDLFPTVVSASGAKLPEGLELDGVDLGPVLFEGGKLSERTLFWRYAGPGSRPGRAARRGPWKLVVYGRKAMLFDLDRDLSEENDLSEKKPELVEALLADLDAWEERVTGGARRKRRP